MDMTMDTMDTIEKRKAEHRAVLRNRVILLLGILFFFSGMALASLFKLSKWAEFEVVAAGLLLGLALMLYALVDALVRTYLHYFSRNEK